MNSEGGTALSANKTYNKYIAIKIVWFGHQIRLRVQEKGCVYREIEYMIKVAFQIMKKKGALFNRSMRGGSGGKLKVNPYLTAYIKTCMGRPCPYHGSFMQD